MSSDSIPYPAPRAWRPRGLASGRVLIERLLARPELLGLLGVTAVLNLWNLSINGWANTYYSAAVRSMSTSWHDFLYASLDKTGLMTVDKPPLALWVEALSARVFGFHPLSILVPEALMGVAAVALLYDLVGRRFGRVAGFVAGLAFAVTPVTVAIARHNNPDELLILCCVAAVWAAARALEKRENALARAERRVRRARLRDEDGRRADGRARDRRGVDVGGAPRPARRAPPAARRRGGDGRGGRRLAAARDADAGRRPAVDLGDLGQQHLVTDLRLQRPRAGRGAVRRAWWRQGRWRRHAVRRRRPASSGCSRPGWATRRAGCSASRWWRA